MATSERPKPVKAADWDRLDVQIEHSGRAITLPAEPGKMPMKKAVEALLRKIKDEEQIFQVAEQIEGYPTDAMVAFYKAMCNLYGWASPVTQQGFFGSGAPSMITIKTGFRDDDVIQCPLGSFMLPGVDEKVNTLVHQGQFWVTSEVKKRDRHLVLEIVTEARRIVREESIYKGKPLRIHVDDDGELSLKQPPEFMDVTDMTEESVLFDDDIIGQIDTNILVPLRYTKQCRKNKVPLKRTVLLSGPYGTGKSLTARMIARVAELNGWTFILLDKVQGLKEALEFGKRYSPAVVFAEDIDRITSERDEQTNDLINMVDGVLTKKSEIMTVLTTNHVEKIHPVMLRPGRLDAVVSLRAPNAETVQRLMRYYGGHLISRTTTLIRAGEEMAGHIPASIRECIERAKLGMLGRDDSELLERDIVIAALSMKAHLALLEPKKAEASAAEKLAESLHTVVNNGSGTQLTEDVRQTKTWVREIHGSVT